ncbi:MAG: hypothetical protein R3A46_20550 [Thermomicrobiales bacterium]
MNDQKKKGLFSRHPRLGILAIGALFLIPICAMVITVAVLILMQIQNAQ